MFKNWRVNLILVIIFLFGGIIFSRLFYLQIIKGDFYKALAQGQQQLLLETKGERGEVYFKNAEILAMAQKEPFLFLSPKEIEEKEKTSEILSEILDIKPENILQKIQKENNFYQPIKENLTPQELQQLEELNLKGVYIDWKPKRYYPQINTASTVIGFLNEEEKGQYGIEEYYDEILKGKEKIEKEKTTPWGFLFSFSNDYLNKGVSLYLTIDYNIQFRAEKLLEEGIEKYGAKGGEIVVLEPDSGKIIAMAQYPNFNPNEYKNVEMELFQNSSISKPFEPGSIFKPITLAAALNEGKVTPETTFEDKTGFVQIGGYKIYNYAQKVWGKRTMTEVLENSINVGAVFAQEQLSHQNFFEYIEKFGFFEKTGVDLAGEVLSKNQEIKKALDYNIVVNFATASFGQGIEMTPLQIARAFCVIANGGKLPKVYVVEKKVDEDGIEEVQPEIIRENVISPETSLDLTNMLVRVVEEGFGKQAKVPGYYIAGKTGTSQIPWSSLGIDRRGYSNETWQSFIGFAPAFDPRFVILVKLNNPTKTKTSEYSATPIFHDLAKYILDYWQIPPDYEVDTE